MSARYGGCATGQVHAFLYFIDTFSIALRSPLSALRSPLSALRSPLSAMKTRAVIAAALLIAATATCQSASARAQQRAAPALTAGDHQLTLRHQGRVRSFFVHVPRRTMEQYPLLFASHGGGGNAPGFQRYAELDSVADREGFIVVYPNGSGALTNSLLTWNAGDGCCGFAMNNRVDDVGFAQAIVDDVARRLPVNRARIYATGHSNGGIMSHRLAAEKSELFAAVVAVAGALDLARFAPTSPVSVLQIHSVNDPRALYAGGLGPPFPGTNNRVQHQSVQAGLDRWIKHNGCRTVPDTAERRSGRVGTDNANHTAIKLVWRGCRNGVEVAHWKLTGVGHAWPGGTRPAAGERLVGEQTTIVRAAEEVWAFVSRFEKKGEE